MTRLIEWLLGLHDIRLGRDAPLLFRWESPIPAWMLLAVGVFAAALIVLIHWRERTSVTRRVVLCVMRGALFALVVAVLCRPTLVLQHNRVEPSYVVLMLDASMSMAAKDEYADEALGGAIARGAGLEGSQAVAATSRFDLVTKAILRDDGAALGRLLEQNGLQVVSFAGTAEPRASVEAGGAPEVAVRAIRDAVPDGTSTDLAGAIRSVIERSHGRRLAAIVLASDGQSTQSTSLKAALDAASDRQVPIYPIRIGSPQGVIDVEVGAIRAQSSVFANDVLVFEAPISVRGLREPMQIKVRLTDDHTGETLAEESVTLDPQSPSKMVELRAKPTRVGDARYRVSVAPLVGERNAENNADTWDVTVLQDRLRVLYVDGYPRFEYRFLKNALIRERTMELSVLLLEADEDFVQEGTEPIRRFPETPEELNHYDVVLFGDVDPRGGWLTPRQMNMLVDHVGNDGGGFGLIAGERFAPCRFLDTPLERLVPVTIDPQFLGRYESALTTGFQPVLTPEGRQSRIFRFTADREKNETLFNSLPELYWVARTLGAKPGASTLAEHPAARSVTGTMPVVVVGRYGAGKLFFQATDDTWRWRRHTGELIYDGYWIRVVRELMQAARGSRDRRLILRTDRRVYTYGQPVQTQVEVLDPQLLGDGRDAMTISVTQSGEVAQPSPPGGVSTPAAVGEFEVHRLGVQSNIFDGVYVPPRSGGFVIAPTDIAAQPDGRTPSVVIRVDRPDLEARRPEADHDVLERIAAATGGKILDLDQLEVEFGAIRDRSVQIPDDITEPLWDSKLVLMIFVLMISMEWGLRKAFGLV